MGGRRLVKKLYQAYFFAPSLKKSTPDRRLGNSQLFLSGEKKVLLLIIFATPQHTKVENKTYTEARNEMDIKGKTARVLIQGTFNTEVV